MRSRTLDRARYSPQLLARVAAGWRQLSERERHGVLQAARITAELTALGAPPSLLALAAHLVQDEVRHLEVCGRVLDALTSAEPGVPRQANELVVSWPRSRFTPAFASAIGTEGGLARVLVAEFALGKPMTATSFASARAVVREPLMAWAYTELLHDETRHARFGAKAASWVVRHWSTRQRQSLWTGCLTATPSDVAFVHDPEAQALGLLPGDAQGPLPPWILPHLAPLGFAHRPSNDGGLLH